MTLMTPLSKFTKAPKRQKELIWHRVIKKAVKKQREVLEKSATIPSPLVSIEVLDTASPRQHYLSPPSCVLPLARSPERVVGLLFAPSV